MKLHLNIHTQGHVETEARYVSSPNASFRRAFQNLIHHRLKVKGPYGIASFVILEYINNSRTLFDVSLKTLSDDQRRRKLSNNLLKARRVPESLYNA